MPFILGLLILPEDDSFWVNWTREELAIKGRMYWAYFLGQKLTQNTSPVSVKISKSNIINQYTVNDLLEKIAKEEWP